MMTRRLDSGRQGQVAGSSWTRSGMASGARGTLPLALEAIAFGLFYGSQARQVGLSAGEALLMSGAVFAGTSQLVVLGLWSSPLPVFSILVSTLLVNLRHVMMGAALYPWFAGRRRLAALGAMWFMTDESWALTLREARSGKSGPGYLVGSGLVLWTPWVATTWLGYQTGGWIESPERWGLDFLLVALFLVLLSSEWRAGSVLPWLTAGVVALVVHAQLGGSWHILFGGLAGCLVGVWRNER